MIFAPNKIGHQHRASRTTKFSLTWRLTRNALPLTESAFKADLADMLDCARSSSDLEKTAFQAFYYCERVRSFGSHVEEWTACIDPKQLVLLDVGYVVDNVNPPWKGEKLVVFLAILAMTWMVIWEMRKNELYDGTNFPVSDRILFFRH